MDALAEAGFEEIELMVTRDPATQDPDLPLKLAEERGLKIASIHGPFLVITKTVWGMEPIEKIKRGVEMCRVVGATSYVVHPPYLWERDYARWIVNESEAFSKESGVTVTVETMYPKWVAGRKARAYRWLKPQALVDAAPYVALDTSHLTVSRGHHRRLRDPGPQAHSHPSLEQQRRRQRRTSRGGTGHPSS